MPPPALEEFQIGWICALPIETAAAQQMLDDNFGTLDEQDAQDTNVYTLGRIGKHYVVIACLGGQYGTTSATMVASNMMRTFSKSLRIGLMVGIGGGIPSALHDIRLGDIVISYPSGTCGGVIQYDTGKLLDGHYTRTGSLNSPPRILLAAVNTMQANMISNDPLYPTFIAEVIGKNARTRRNFGRQDIHDQLFKARYKHPKDEDTCEKCSKEWKVARDEREDDEPQPHYGIIASGNTVIKDALIRDQIQKDTGALCFEMEAAGLMQDFSCIVIRGICDYADSHKNKKFQGFAALAAAAYTKELLGYVPRGQISKETLIADISGIVDSLNNLELLNQQTSQKIEDMRQEIDLSKLPIASDAVFGAYANQYESECLLGTRIDILHKVAEWAASPTSKCIFWLNGMAGTGKSTISRTVARSFKDKGMLGASFFFKKGEGERGNATRFISTITTQLINAIPELIPFIRMVIDEDSGIAQKSLQDQFEKLLLRPLLGLEKSAQSSPLIIVIDALDECDVDNDIRHIIRLLSQLQEASIVQLRIFLTSRPELPIRLGFKDIAENHEFLVLHEIEKTELESDISLFLKHRLAEIRKDRSLPIDWPGSTNIHTLATMSTPLFIFAATVCRILEDPRWDPVDSLGEILTYQTEDSTLNAVYVPILDQLFVKQQGKRREQLINEYKEVVGTIIMLESPLSAMALSKLLGISHRLVNVRLDSLHSVLHVPRDDTTPVKLLHLSFRDFLLDASTRERTPLWIDGKDVQTKLTAQCIEVLSRHLTRNICNLPSYGSERKEIDARIISQYLPPEVQYACRYWAQHLTQSKNPSVEITKAFTFLGSHFYHWIEAMSILGFATEVVKIIKILQSVIPDNEDYRVSELLYDSKRFMLKNAYILDVAPLQVYSSGLIFAPRSAIIREKVEEFPTWICGLPRVEENWSADFQTLEGHTNGVLSVAFSPDGRLLASGSLDKTIKIWDIGTGALERTINGHKQAVHSVFFASDSGVLISGSTDGTIRFWDVATGALHRTLDFSVENIEHMSAAISRDGQLLATGCGRIEVWNIATGSLHHTPHDEWVLDAKVTLPKELGTDNIFTSANDGALENRSPASGDKNISDDRFILRDESFSSNNLDQMKLEGHVTQVQCITFSRNGQILVSGSNDSNIYLWNMSTGAKENILIGHEGYINSVTFSPLYDQLLASCSGDRTIRLWNISSGTTLYTFEETSYAIQSVAFSPDGCFLASGSTDIKIMAWKPSPGHLQTLRGHGSWLISLAFSPDGLLLASGSFDATIMLWDISIKYPEQNSGHLEYIQSMEFSPDGKFLASRSADNIVNLWNTANGTLKHTFEEPSTPASSEDSLESARFVQAGFVKFSPNGQMLASCSGDHKITLWNITTQSLEQIFNDESGQILSVAFSSDGQFLLSGSTNGTAKLWNIATAAIQQVISHDDYWVETVAFSPDSHIVTSDYEKIARVLYPWDSATTTALRPPQSSVDRDGGWLAFSPNGRVMARGYSGLQLWDILLGEVLQSLQHRGVQALAFSPDGELLASSSQEKSIKLWEVSTGALLQTFNIQRIATNLTFSRDGSQLFTNLGSLNIHPWSGTNVAATDTEVFIQDYQWITVNGERVLWLPPEYRPFCSTFRDGILALGHESGKVSLMRFNT